MARVGVAEDITTPVSTASAHPTMKPGARRNHMTTRRLKRPSVQASWKVTGPSSRYFSLNMADTPSD